MNCNPVKYGEVSRYHSGEGSISIYSNPFLLIHLQVRSSWIPESSHCSLPNAESNTATFVSMFITDFALLVIMLVGLLLLRRRGAGAFGLGHLLWKQVS
jgi:hypothetical protein